MPVLLIGLLLPACGEGVAGVPLPVPMDMNAIVRPASPNTALAGPAGFKPDPDTVTPRYDVPPAALYAAVKAVAAAQPRTFPHAMFDDRMQAHYVVRSAVLGFPDLVTAQVLTLPDPGRSELVLYSRSVYGYSDLGVNGKRVTAWLADLNARLAAPR